MSVHLIFNSLLKLEHTHTFLIDGVDSFAHLFPAVGVHVHVGEHPGLVGPQVVVGTEEVDRELPDVVPHPEDVLRDRPGVTDLRRPPPEERRRRGERRGGERRETEER